MPLSSAGGKKSIFARQIAAQRLMEGKTPLYCAPEAAQKHKPREQNLPPESMDTDGKLSTLVVCLPKSSFTFTPHLTIKSVVKHVWTCVLFCPLFSVYSLLSTHQSKLQSQARGWCLVRGLWAQIAQETPCRSTGRTKPRSRRCLSLRY